MVFTGPWVSYSYNMQLEIVQVKGSHLKRTLWTAIPCDAPHMPAEIDIYP